MSAAYISKQCSFGTLFYFMLSVWNYILSLILSLLIYTGITQIEVDTESWTSNLI